MKSRLDPTCGKTPLTAKQYQQREVALTRLIDTWRSVHPGTLPNREQARLGERWIVDVYEQLIEEK